VTLNYPSTTILLNIIDSMKGWCQILVSSRTRLGKKLPRYELLGSNNRISFSVRGDTSIRAKFHNNICTVVVIGNAQSGRKGWSNALQWQAKPSNTISPSSLSYWSFTSVSLAPYGGKLGIKYSTVSPLAKIVIVVKTSTPLKHWCTTLSAIFKQSYYGWKHFKYAIRA